MSVDGVEVIVEGAGALDLMSFDSVWAREARRAAPLTRLLTHV